MTTLRMGSQLWIVLNTERAITDILMKRSKATNERPDMPIASSLVSKDKRAVIRKLSGWGEGRRLMQHLLTGSALREYAQLEEHESCRLLLSYLRHPERWYKHHFRYSTAILHRIVMGEKLTKTQKQLDEYQCVTNEFLFSLFRSGVDFFPEFAYLLPRRLQFWRPYWEKMGDFHKRVFQEWWDPVRKSVQEGTAEASFVRDALLNPESKYTGDDEDAMYLATSLTAAGGDNTRMTLNVFVMAALCEPEAFHQARAELDTTCGSDIETMRLPRVTDMESMPYMCAFIKEVLRWRPTVPLIPPHQLTEPQLEYEGYNFPKGTNFLVNNISVCYDCVDPGIFWPERWINGQGTESNVIHNFWGFGSGRRICVGYKIEQHILFVAISRLIYCFDYAEVCSYLALACITWSWLFLECIQADTMLEWSLLQHNSKSLEYEGAFSSQGHTAEFCTRGVDFKGGISERIKIGSMGLYFQHLSNERQRIRMYLFS